MAMPVVRFAVPPGQVFSPENIQPIMGSLNTLVVLPGADHRKRGRFDSHLPPVYEKNLRASEITLAEAMKKMDTKPFSPANGILGAKDHGQQTMDLTLIKVVGMSVVHAEDSSRPTPIQILNLVRTESRLLFGSGRKPLISLRLTRTNPWPTFPTTLFMLPSKVLRHSGKKYRDKAEKMGLTNEKERFLFDRRLNVRQVQDCPIYAGMIELLMTPLDSFWKSSKSIIWKIAP